MIVFEKFNKQHHDRDSFDCINDDLNVYIKTVANQQQYKGLNVIYVAVKDSAQILKRIYGYYNIPQSEF